ncbi:hypothetical protein KIN20_003386, partial [Parelaphostrongylus tenuis]
NSALLFDEDVRCSRKRKGQVYETNLLLRTQILSASQDKSLLKGYIKTLSERNADLS